MECLQCLSSFEITDEDKKYLDYFGVPMPKRCPRCRLIRRLMERNARSLYFRKCDYSGKEIISMYHENQPFPVYDQSIWWTDIWDALEYGRDYDFSRSFFEQYRELKNVVPHFSVFVVGGTLQNSQYTNCTGYLKNCYLISESDYNEDCMYSNRIYQSKDVLDCSNGYNLELCYECVDCLDSYRLFYSEQSKNCNNSYFLRNCIGCSDCLGCVNQRQKKFMIFNKQYSENEYHKIFNTFLLNTHLGREAFRNKFLKFMETQPRKPTEGEHNENVIGNNVYDSKNAYMCFDSKDLEDCRYCTKVASNVKNCLDYTSWGFNAELVYESSACGDGAYNLKFCSTCTTNISNLEYCFQCTSSSDLFGCVGVKNKKYCILN